MGELIKFRPHGKKKAKKCKKKDKKKKSNKAKDIFKYGAGMIGLGIGLNLLTD